MSCLDRAGFMPLDMARMGGGRSKCLDAHPGNRPVPQIFAREGFGGGYCLQGAPAIQSGPDQGGRCGVDLVRLLVATACPVR